MDELKKLGLTGYEISVYKCLLEYGKCNAKNISNYSNVPPTAVYPNIKNLIKKGLIQQIKGDISEFEALDPKISIKSLADKRSKEIKLAEEIAITNIKQIVNKKEIETREDIVELSHGLKASHSITNSFMIESKETLYILGWRFTSQKNLNMYGNLNKLKELVDKKIDVRLIMTNLIPKTKKQLKLYKNSGIKIRYYPINNFSIILCDGKKCKITLKNKEIQERLNLFIKDKDLSKSLKEYFISVWNKSEDVYSKI
jgi:sugar-specific transcriptional regulator TrmB